MKASKLPKDKMRTIRISSEVLAQLEKLGFPTVQKFIDAMIDKNIKVEIKKTK